MTKPYLACSTVPSRNRIASALIAIVAATALPTWAGAAPSQGADTGTKAVDVRLEGGDTVRVEAVAPAILRVRLSGNGRFPQSLMERYGILKTDWPAVETRVETAADGVTLTAPEAALSVRKADGMLTLRDGKGKIVVQRILPLRSRLSADEQQAYQKRQADLAAYFLYAKKKHAQPLRPILGDSQTFPSDTASIEQLPAAELSRRFGATFSIGPDERFYGLGAAASNRLQLRGQAYRNFPEYRGAGGFDSHTAKWEQTDQPNPLVLSSGGWGLLVNTTWLHYVDVGRYEPDRMFVWGPGGDLDLYLMVGSDLPRLIDLYTQITGRPIVLPLWGYGLMNITNMAMNQFEVLGEAERFRKERIPCDMIALEPGWMEKNYDFSHAKDWNHARFDTSWQPREWTFQSALRRMNFKLFLWLCCDDDLSQEEERQIAVREGRPAAVPAKPDAWFNHLRKLIDQGVEGFKIDPERLVEPHPGMKYFNGRGDLEMHNLVQVLLHKQMWLGFTGKEGHAARRHMHHYCGAYAGVQRWGATTCGDNADEKGLCWVLAQGLSGHMNTTYDLFPMECGGRPQGSAMHANFLLPWVELCNWDTALQPWYLGPEREQMFKDYTRLRYRLLPYLYSIAHEGAQSGMPMARAMPLVFPDDRHCDDLTRQWMLGPWLLTTAYTDEVYLPAGRWIDFWSGAEHVGPKQFKPSIPASRGGPLFVRAGAILPTGPEVLYAGQKPMDKLGLEIWPETRSQFTLYEDDGETYRYLDGQVARTQITCQADNSRTIVTIAPRAGRYDGMPEKRSFDLRLHTSRPAEVKLNGLNLAEGAGSWTCDAAARILSLNLGEDPERKTASVLEITLGSPGVVSPAERSQ